ncbi:MAG: RICIN domain-containing protein [Clostridia bacterium]|nr:RICIN domain-containing protein [Clostridia bacterium]
MNHMSPLRHFLTCFLFVLIVVISIQEIAFALTAISGEPSVARIEYEENANVECGTIRYVCQDSGKKNFFISNYWGPKWKSRAGSECGTACVSMALSYVGVNKTPKDILDLGYKETGEPETFWDKWAPAKMRTPKSIEEGMRNYINGNGRYSPVIVHFRKGSYSNNGHYVCLVGKDSSGNYLVCDPWKTSIWTLKKTDAYYKAIDGYFQYENKTASIPYMRYCTSYEASGTVVISNATTIKSLPCSRDTDNRSTDIRSAKKNERYWVQGLYKNTVGNYWYKVLGMVDSQNRLSTPVIGYVYAGYTNPVANGWSGYSSRDGKTASQTLFPNLTVTNISGLYELSPQCAPNARLDAENGSKKSGTNVQIYANNGTEAQLFRFTPLNNGYYKITCVVSGMALDVSGGIALSGNNVQLYTPNGSDAQQWKLVDAGGGYYYIISKLNSNMCLDVWNKGSANGTNIHIWEKNNSSAQKWKLIR